MVQEGVSMAELPYPFERVEPSPLTERQQELVATAMQLSRLDTDVAAAWVQGLPEDEREWLLEWLQSWLNGALAVIEPFVRAFADWAEAALETMAPILDKTYRDLLAAGLIEPVKS
jgi:cytochrome P450